MTLNIFAGAFPCKSTRPVLQLSERNPPPSAHLRVEAGDLRSFDDGDSRLLCLFCQCRRRLPRVASRRSRFWPPNATFYDGSPIISINDFLYSVSLRQKLVVLDSYYSLRTPSCQCQRSFQNLNQQRVSPNRSEDSNGSISFARRSDTTLGDVSRILELF